MSEVSPTLLHLAPGGRGRGHGRGRGCSHGCGWKQHIFEQLLGCMPHVAVPFFFSFLIQVVKKKYKERVHWHSQALCSPPV